MQLLLNVPGHATKLKPVAAFQSSRSENLHNAERLGPEKCIDGIIDNLGDFWHPNFSLCATRTQRAPWLAIDYGEGVKVSVEEVVLYDRVDCCIGRTRNIEIWLADKIPTSGEQKFSDGKMLATLPGAVHADDHGRGIVIHSRSGWENKFGRFLIIQINAEKGTILNLREVIATGVFYISSNGKFNLLQSFNVILFLSEWISAEYVFSDKECPNIGFGSKISVAACQVLAFHCCSTFFSRNLVRKQGAVQLSTGSMRATMIAS